MTLTLYRISLFCALMQIVITAQKTTRLMSQLASQKAPQHWHCLGANHRQWKRVAACYSAQCYTTVSNVQSWYTHWRSSFKVAFI